MNALAIILARGGSKGVPGKNVREVGGRPCIAWTILAAQSAEHVGRVVVSTDDGRAMEIARAMGAEVLERPAALATDGARVDDAARDAVKSLEVAGGRALDVPIVILYANVPVRPADLIDRALERLGESGCDSVQSYQGVGKNHPWWTARLSKDGEVEAWEGEVLNHGVFRRQDLPPAYVPDGGVIALTRAALMLEVEGVGGVKKGPHTFFGRDRRGVVNAEGSVVDIDSEIDVLVADAVLRRGMGAVA